MDAGRSLGGKQLRRLADYTASEPIMQPVDIQQRAAGFMPAVRNRQANLALTFR